MVSETILAATDLSARSDRAIDRALQLGRDLGLPVEVVHVREKGMGDVEGSGLREAIRSVLPDPNADCAILTLTGPVPTVIAKAAEERAAAIIVTGVARFNSFGDYVLGTAVDKILRHAKAPVLIVKHRPHKPYRRVLCAVDFSRHSGYALRTALKLFPASEVVALHAYHVPFEGWIKGAQVRKEVEEEAQTSFERFLADLPLLNNERQRLEHRTGYGDVGEVLRKEVDRHKPDLVVFGTHGMGGIRQAMIGSIASSLLEWVIPDTMVVPPS